jgi:hypothetical protein
MVEMKLSIASKISLPKLGGITQVGRELNDPAVGRRRSGRSRLRAYLRKVQGRPIEHKKAAGPLGNSTVACGIQIRAIEPGDIRRLRKRCATNL